MLEDDTPEKVFTLMCSGGYGLEGEMAEKFLYYLDIKGIESWVELMKERYAQEHRKREERIEKEKRAKALSDKIGWRR